MHAFQQSLGVSRDKNEEDSIQNEVSKDVYDLPCKASTYLNKIPFFTFCPCLPSYIDRDISCQRCLPKYRKANRIQDAGDNVELANGSLK